MGAPPGLTRLARLHGIQTAYHDNDGRRIVASPEVLMGALRALRVPLRDAADVGRLVELRRRELWDQVLEPVVVVWRGKPCTATLRVPARRIDRPIHLAINFEDGGVRRWSVEPKSIEVVDRADLDGATYFALAVPLPDVATGYHDLRVGLGVTGEGGRFEALLISAPPAAIGWDRAIGSRGWGLFAPLYALWEDAPGGAETAAAPGLHLLDRLADRVAEHGGSVVGTLPLMAAFLDEPYEPSPYAPVSRLFWNELYLDPPAAADPGDAVNAAAPAADIGAAFSGGLFDPRAAMAAKRPALEAGAREFFAQDDPEELASFRARNPEADDYARFRALVARWGPWDRWQDRLRGRDVRAGDYDEAEARYHLYVQWLAERQLTMVRERAESRGVGLYLDLPLGVHSLGYDVWRERELFAAGASAGAPPDALSAEGQDWGFLPLHPEAARFERHRYFIACIRNHLRFARVLRIDHVMQLHRMYWVVDGDARGGVYVRHPAEELYAILSLESHRARAVVVGEDLGTVPRSVRRGMRRRGLPGMYVGQFELTEIAEGRLAPKPVPAGALASIGTHDTPTFQAWWAGRDLDIRRELGHATDEEAAREREGRAQMRRKLAAGLGVDDDVGDERRVAAEVHLALLRRLGRSRAGLVLATMEDLWLESEPQNMPGTLRPENWRRQARRPIDGLGQPDVVVQLDALNEAREGTND